MDYIKYDDVPKLVAERGINFIATATTPWHSHGVDVAIQSLIKEGVEVKGVVLIAIAEKGCKPIIDESNFYNESCCYYYIDYPRYNYLYILKMMYNHYRAISRISTQSEYAQVVYICSPWHINIRLYSIVSRLLNTYKYKFIMYEEGLATYFPCNKLSYKNIFFANNNKGLARRVLSGFLSIYSDYIYKRFTREITYLNFNLFFENESLVPNIKAINEYRNILSQKSKILPCANDVSILDQSVIICTQAYKRNEIHNNYDINILTKLVKELKSANFNVILKPHPREDNNIEYYKNLGCNILQDNGISLEDIFTTSSGNIKTVISFSSTALITAKLLYNINSISIINMLELNQYGKYIQDEMLSFKTCFSGIIPMPTNLEELINNIRITNGN